MTDAMKICAGCSAPYVESGGFCESDRCTREEAEYERFCYYNGNHCYDCFREAMLNGGLTKAREPFPDEPQLFLDAPVCPNCHSTAQVAPMQEGKKAIGWMCGICAWTKFDK